MCDSVLSQHFWFLQLVEIEYMQDKNFIGDSAQSLIEMRPVIENDNSSANIHLAFLNHCHGGRAYLSQICKPSRHLNLAVNCMLKSKTLFL